jgi:3D (Asp-Asp-Asp) domain-containing protein
VIRWAALAVVCGLLVARLAWPRRPVDRLRDGAIAHAPVLVLPTPRLSPLLVRAKRPPPRDSVERAAIGVEVPVHVTAYCLRGFTRLGHAVREGIVAADPRVFPLGTHLDLWIGGKHRGRFLVSDTGRLIKGRRIDLWTPSCVDAIRFGRRRGKAVLVASEGG